MFASKVIDYSPPITEETRMKWYKSVMLTMGGPRYAEIVESEGNPPLLILHYGDYERELGRKASEFWLPPRRHDSGHRFVVAIREAAACLPENRGAK